MRANGAKCMISGGILVVASWIAAPESSAQAPDVDREVHGAIPGEVAAQVYVLLSRDDEGHLLAHDAVNRVVVRSDTWLTIELDSGARYTLPLDIGRTEEIRALVQSSTDNLLKLEYHPYHDATPGNVYASWTLSPHPSTIGEGLVPLGGELYLTILRIAGDDMPRTGIFEPIVRARKSLDALLKHVSDGDGRETEELTDRFRAAVGESRLHLGFYKTHEGEPVTEEFLQGLREQGVTISAQQYWKSAARKVRSERPANVTLDRFETEWKKCPPDATFQVPFPGRGKQRISEQLLLDMRRKSVQGFIDRAELAAEAGRVGRTDEQIQGFRDELAAANATAQRFAMSDFLVLGKPASEERLVYLAKKARGETGFWGFFRVLWRRMTGTESRPIPPPA